MNFRLKALFFVLLIGKGNALIRRRQIVNGKNVNSAPSIYYKESGDCGVYSADTVFNERKYRVTLSFYGELNETPQTFSFSFLSLPPSSTGDSPYYSYTIMGNCDVISFAKSNLTYVVKSIQVKLKDTESLAFLECAPSTPVDTIVDLHNVNCSSSIITRLPSLIDVTSTLSISFFDVYFLLNHNNNQVLFSEVSKSTCSNVVLQVVAN
ncbi:hypothetical protein WA588_000833, partial [Blastocystis sp. NMH]